MQVNYDQSVLGEKMAQSMFSQRLNTGGSAGGDVPIYSINSALSQILERRIVSKSHYRGSSRRSCFFPGNGHACGGDEEFHHGLTMNLSKKHFPISRNVG